METSGDAGVLSERGGQFSGESDSESAKTWRGTNKAIRLGPSTTAWSSRPLSRVNI
jgi:hypothetical protein